MTEASHLYARFHAAILNVGDDAILADIYDAGGLTPVQRMGIYRDAYRLRLLQALRDDYPALAAYLGAGLDTLAAGFGAAHPPAHYNLDLYGFVFADYVARNSNDAFAVDLARLEGAIAEAYMASDSEALTPQGLAALAPEELAAAVLKPRLSLRLLTLNHPARMWLEQQRQGMIGAAPPKQIEYLALVRQSNEVQTHKLGEAAFALLRLIAGGSSIGEALDAFTQNFPQHEGALAISFQTWFSGWVASGFFTR